MLVVAAREPWPLSSGGPLRLYNFLKWLVPHTAVTLALPRPAQHASQMPTGLRVAAMLDAAPAGELRKGNQESGPADRWLGRSLARPVRSFGAGSPLSVPWLIRRVQRHFGYRPAVLAWLGRYGWPEHFDVALLSGAVTGQYIHAIQVPVVWDVVDDLVLYTARDSARRRPWRWPGALGRAMLYAAFERHVARRVRATVFASTVDASYARRWVGGRLVEAISNGVDCDYFNDPAAAPEPGTVAFVGSLGFPPNADAALWFARRVWPQLHASGRARRLLIVGRDPPAAVRALAGLPGIELHADVPDVRPFLWRAAVVVVPTRLGGGVKNKVLEACAAGRPVVASSRALGGLSARPGRDVLCADCPAAWVGHVSRLLERPAWARAIAASGQAWVRQAHSWPALTRRLAALLEAAADCPSTIRPEPGAKCRVHSANWKAQSERAPASTVHLEPGPSSIPACQSGEPVCH